MDELVQIIHNKPGYVLVQFVYLNLLPQVIKFSNLSRHGTGEQIAPRIVMGSNRSQDSNSITLRCYTCNGATAN